MRNLFLSTRYLVLYILLFFSSSVLRAQVYNDYFGNGHNYGIKVEASHKTQGNNFANTLSGDALRPDMPGASRFLAQATLGHDYEDILSVHESGIGAWLDEQMTMDFTPFNRSYRDNRAYIENRLNDEYDDGLLNNFTFYTKVFGEEDKLRQKMANALLQIMVVSMRVDQLRERGREAATYYDIFYKNAFGNFRDIIEMVTLHPMMGIYLSHFRNAQANYARNTFPDENFAREIMQLFTIGLVQLNLDGTPVMDESGQPVPTYDNGHIFELAKVFTGLAGSQTLDNRTPEFGLGSNRVSLAHPMKMYELEHDITEKKLINNVVLPAGQSGEADLEAALDMLFNHPNVGPFIGLRLIQHFVKSNPTPEYVRRVAMVFNNNGQGVRGDMGAVIKAILVDPEARECEWIENPENGKLLQPIERFTKLFCAFNINTPSGKFFMNDGNYSGLLGQSFYNAPSVFNYFSPFFAEEQIVKPAGLVSPEFEIFNSVTSIGYFNQIEDRIKEEPFENLTRGGGDRPRSNSEDAPSFFLREEKAILKDRGVSAMLDRLNLVLCRGQLSDTAKSIIQAAIEQYRSNVSGYSDGDAVRDAIYFISVSPDFIIQN